MRLALVFVSLAAALTGTSGCAAVAAQRPMTPAQDALSAAAPAPPPLERSLFARDPNGQLTEEALQRIIDAPVEVELPARVGVLPILPPADWHGPAPDYRGAPAGSGAFTRALTGTEPFTLVTEMMPIPSGALGMEALREIAARYRLRYLLLYREVSARRVHANGAAAGYITLLGAFFLPGQTLGAHGYLEASLFDVKTGTLLFTVRRDFAGERISNVWHQQDKLDDLVAKLVGDAVPRLAADVRTATTRYETAAREENHRRHPPVASTPVAVPRS